MPPSNPEIDHESQNHESRARALVWLSLGELLLAVIGGAGLLLLPVEFRISWWSSAGVVSDLARGLLATLPLLALAAMILMSRRGPLKRLQTFVVEYIAPLLAGASLGHLVCLAAAAGFCEELLFRGLIQQIPSVWIPGPVGVVMGVAVSALLFGLAHAMTRSYFVLATLISVYFSAITLLSASLVVAMLAHGIYDLIAMIVILREHRRREGCDGVGDKTRGRPLR